MKTAIRKCPKCRYDLKKEEHDGETWYFCENCNSEYHKDIFIEDIKKQLKILDDLVGLYFWKLDEEEVDALNNISSILHSILDQQHKKRLISTKEFIPKSPLVHMDDV